MQVCVSVRARVHAHVGYVCVHVHGVCAHKYALFRVMGTELYHILTGV